MPHQLLKSHRIDRRLDDGPIHDAEVVHVAVLERQTHPLQGDLVPLGQRRVASDRGGPLRFKGGDGGINRCAS